MPPDQVWQETAHWCGAAAQPDVGVEQLLTVDLDAVRDAHEADVASRSCRTQSLGHGLGCADAFEDGVGADAVGEVLDMGHAVVAAFGDDVGGAELAGELLPRLVRLNAMIRSALSCLADSTPSRPTAPSPTTATVLPGCTLAATAAYQPVPSTSDAVSRLGSSASSGTSGVATRVPSASGTRRASAWAPPTNSRCWQEVWNPAWQCGQVCRRRRTSR